MCGIAGIIKNNERPEKKKVEHMLNLISHRGPDHDDIFEGKNICLGHCRLSIIDLSTKANQPMKYEDKAVVAYNGEIYNFKELRKNLREAGFRFKSKSDTEVLLLGYIHWGEGIINKIKGFFSFAIWDIKKEILFCARDPFGKKPFYYYWDKKRFIFASEIESLIKGIGFRPKINYEGIPNYLLKGYFEPGLSIYKDIQTLKAGHFLRINTKKNHLEVTPYYVPKFHLNEIDIGYKEACKETKKLLEQATKKRLMSDVPLGSLLSGGVDSSLITLLSSKNCPKPIEAFTIAFKDKRFDESIYAKQIATNFNIKHKISHVSDINLPSFLSKMVQVYGEPFGDYSCMPTYQVFEAVKTHLKVVLTGDGGDEVFGGYIGTEMYLLRKKLQPFLKYLPFLFYGWPEIFLYSKHRLCRQLSHAGLAMRSEGSDAFYSLFRDSWTERQRKRFMSKQGWEKTGKNKTEKDFKSQYKNSGRNDMERYLNLRLERLTELFLVKTDRASMAHSIEARCPMLDLDLFNFVSKLPEKVLFHKKIRKSIPKTLLTQKMNKDFVYRKKMGFTPPLSSWLKKKKIAEWTEKKLLNPNGIVYELFEPKGIKRMIKEHQKGHDHTARIWKLLVLEEWFEKNNLKI